MYKLIRPNLGWVRVLWPRDAQHSLEAQLALSAVAPIPGCKLEESFLDVSHTAWMLEPVQELFQTLDVDGAAPANPLLELPWKYGRAWDPKRPLYSYQERAAFDAVLQRGFLLADDMGLGKSASAIVAAECVLRAKVSEDQPFGVIIGLLSTRESWKRELLALGAIKDESEFCALKSKDLHDPSFRTEGVRWYFLHFAITQYWWSQFNMHKPTVCIVDEAHYIRNSKTKRAQGTLMFAGVAQFRVLTTGTPLDNRISDLWNLLTVATGPRTWGHPLDFRKRYMGAYFDGYGFKDGPEPTHTEELRQRMAPFYLRRTAQDVALELPTMTRTLQSVDLDKRAQKAHDEILGSADLETIVRAVLAGAVREVLPVLNRLRQVTSRAKIDTTVDYVFNLVRNQGLDSCVVFCWERQTARDLADVMSTRGCIHGGIPAERRFELIDDFQDGQIDILVATYGTLAEGTTLHKSRYVVLHDLDWMLNTLLQAEKRIHRVGQKRACQSVWMVAENSIDSVLAPTLVRKANLMNEVLDIGDGIAAMQELELVQPDRIEEEIETALALWEAQRR